MNNVPNHPSGGSGGTGRRRRRGRRGHGANPGQSQAGTQQSRNHGGGHGSTGHSGGSNVAGPRGQRSGSNAGPRGQRPARPSRPKSPDSEIYSAPMDHSYRALQNGNNNGRQRPGFGSKQYSPASPEPLPTVLNDTSAPKIYAYVNDLFFMAKIQETARKINVKVEFVKTEKDILERVAKAPEEKPSLIIFDLNNLTGKPLSMIPKLKTKLKKGTNIIGFLSHIQGELKLKAIEAGCDMVVPRSAFSQNLPQLLRRHGAPEELQEEM